MPYKTLEEILQFYFGCKCPFKKDGSMTQNGERAYRKLVSLIYDTKTLLGDDVSFSADEIVNELDIICEQKY